MIALIASCPTPRKAPVNHIINTLYLSAIRCVFTPYLPILVQSYLVTWIMLTNVRLCASHVVFHCTRVPTRCKHSPHQGSRIPPLMVAASWITFCMKRNWLNTREPVFSTMCKTILIRDYSWCPFSPLPITKEGGGVKQNATVQVKHF